MKRLLLLFSGATFVLLSCQTKTDASKSMTGPQHPTNPYYSRTDTSVVNISDDEWKKVLPHDMFEVARHKETERAFTGKFWEHTGIGTYYCAACGNALFRSDNWFASSCGWPSFFETIRATSVIYNDDTSYGISRIEVLCGRCGGHLGHVFDDGPPPTGKRFCMNSIMLDFIPNDSTNVK